MPQQPTKTPSQEITEKLVEDHEKNNRGRGAAPLPDAIRLTEDQLRDDLRTAGLIEYREQRAAKPNGGAYMEALARVDRAATRLDALYAFRTKICHDDVATARGVMKKRVQDVKSFQERVATLATPPFVDERSLSA
jgi:hypothetical protein